MNTFWISFLALGLVVGPSLAQEGKPAPKPQFPPPGRRPQDRPLQTPPVKESLTIPQTPKTPPPPTPEELAEGRKRLDALVAALGGDAFLKLSAVSFVGTGSASLPGAGDIDFESIALTYASPDRVRLDVKSVFGEISQVVPGAGKKSFMIMAGQVQDAPFEFSLPDPTGILREAVQRNLAVRPIPDRVEGKNADKKTFPGIALPDEPGKPSTKLYFDSEKNYIRRVVLKNKQGELTVNMADFKTTDGITLPTLLSLYQGKDPLLTLKFSSAKINPTLSEDFFSAPKNAGR